MKNPSVYKLEVPTPVTGLMNVGVWLSRQVAPQLLTARKQFLELKHNQEILSATLIAAVASFRTVRVWIPAFVEKENSVVDSVVLDSSGTGADIQVVSTKSNPKLISEENMTDIVWSRIEHKHSKGKQYADKVYLAVFVHNQNYSINLEELNRKINTSALFWSYWIIAPYGETDECKFVVANLYSEGASTGYECLVEFTPPNPLKIGYLGDFLSGKPLATLVDVLRNIKKTTGGSVN